MKRRAALLLTLFVLGSSVLASSAAVAAGETPGVVAEEGAPPSAEVVTTYWLTDGTYDYRVLVNGRAVNGESLRVGSTEGQDIVGGKNGPDFGWATVERNRYQGVAGTDFDLLSSVGPLPLSFLWTNNIGGTSGTGQLWLTDPNIWFHESFNDGVANGWGGGSGTWVVADSTLPNSRNSKVFETAGMVPDGWQDVYYLERTYSSFGYEASFKRGPADDGKGTMALYMRSDGTMNNGIKVGIVQGDYPDVAVYAVHKWVGGTEYVVLPWTPSANLITGTDVDADAVLDSPVWNTVKVVVSGGQYDIYLNHTYETSIFDRSFTSGYVGLLAFNADAVDVVQADNVTLDPYAQVVPLAQVVSVAPVADGGDGTGVH